MGRQGRWIFVVYWYQDGELDLASAHVAQLVERVLGKDEVISSTLIMGSKLRSLGRGTLKLSRNPSIRSRSPDGSFGRTSNIAASPATLRIRTTLLVIHNWWRSETHTSSSGEHGE